MEITHFTTTLVEDSLYSAHVWMSEGMSPLMEIRLYLVEVLQCLEEVWYGNGVYLFQSVNVSFFGSCNIACTIDLTFKSKFYNHIMYLKVW